MEYSVKVIFLKFIKSKRVFSSGKDYSNIKKNLTSKLSEFSTGLGL